jgi:dipeptidase E
MPIVAQMKLLLSSLGPSPSHDRALVGLAAKPLGEIQVGYIENAYDVFDDQATLDEGRESLTRDGYAFELVDLRQWRDDHQGLRELLGQFDAFLLAGGNPYYLRSLMKLTGADALIAERVRDGVIYAGASAAAVVAGPTLRHFDELDDPHEAEELIWDGLGLTQIVVAPHVDNPDFGAGCRRAGDLCAADGYTVQRLADAQALVIDGDELRLV